MFSTVDVQMRLLTKIKNIYIKKNGISYFVFIVLVGEAAEKDSKKLLGISVKAKMCLSV